MEPCPTLSELSDGEFLHAFVRKAEAQGIPLAASLELTERCNLNCVHCYLGDQGAQIDDVLEYMGEDNDVVDPRAPKEAQVG